MQRKSYIKFLMWLVPLSFFTYQFILRLWPGLMIEEIKQQFHIDATYFGILASFYYYGYSLSQIPIALLLDRFGVRYILSLGVAICGISTLLFTYTDSFIFAVITRFCVGMGSAVGFLAISKILCEWFEDNEYGKMVGYSFTIGLMGAIYGGKPLGVLVKLYNWQDISLILSIIAFIIAIVAYTFLHSPKTKQNSDTVKKSLNLSDLKNILASKNIWLLATANFLMVGALEGFADVWGISYLMQAYDISKENAAGLTSCIFFGMLFGGPILTWFSKKYNNYNTIMFCGIGIATCFISLLFFIKEPQLLLSTLLFISGSLCCYQVLIFALGAELFVKEHLGIAIAFLNSINMLGGSFFHSIIGKTMDLLWQGDVRLDGSKLYLLDDYRYALSIIPICALIGSCLIIPIMLDTRKNRYRY